MAWNFSGGGRAFRFWALRDEIIIIIFLPRVLCGNGFFCLAVSLASIKPLSNAEGGVDVKHDMQLVFFLSFLSFLFCNVLQCFALIAKYPWA